MWNSELSKSFIAGNLKKLRKYCGFKTLEVAEFLNLTSSAYGYYETGRTTPPLGKLIKIAVPYDMTVEEFYIKPSELLAHLERETNLAEIKRSMQLTEEPMLLFRSSLED